MGKSADATNGYKSDTRKKREILRNACGELEREPNIDAGKRIARKELFASFCEEYIADYITKLPLDGQYQPLSSLLSLSSPISRESLHLRSRQVDCRGNLEKLIALV